MSLTNSPWRGIIKLFPARESLAVTSRLGKGKSQTLFIVYGTIVPMSFASKDVFNKTYNTALQEVSGISNRKIRKKLRPAVVDRYGLAIGPSASIAGQQLVAPIGWLAGLLVF
jgi:hypothetical protein